MFNIRYGIKFMTKHVVFMGAADTTNDVMHFISKNEWLEWEVGSGIQDNEDDRIDG